MPPRERIVASGIALTFAFAATIIALTVPLNREADPVLLVSLVALLALARRVRFEVGTLEACIDQLAFIPMLLLAPLPLVPVLCAAAYVLERLPDILRGRMHVDRWLYFVGDAWHSIAMVAVIATLAPGSIDSSHVPVYALALAAQVTMSFAVVAVNDSLIHGFKAREIFTLSAAQGLRIDAALTPLAIVIAAAAESEPVALAGVVPFLWLIQLFSNERRERYAAALELNQAYRGTVMVLSDVVEAEDNYTASHCRSVVELAAAVADELGLGYEQRQELEIAALLHDVGKIAIPNEILNKPAKLTDEEFDLMKTHTIEGQALLDRVGGRLAKVGQIVRSCHERWDGRGYPDGLAGEEIPMAARIVFCCDAYSAMTTNRPYRQAMPRENAIAELRTNSGSQFEPRVVEALVTVVEADLAGADDDRYTDALRAVLAGNSAPALELTA
ncbi:MAG: HD-GYP domain-containing protein [Actinomycetota bacterium]|nr:HD-GYP domain-containing protein [Actinomycetota bacterium]